jgi:hypothetical protein
MKHGFCCRKTEDFLADRHRHIHRMTQTDTGQWQMLWRRKVKGVTMTGKRAFTLTWTSQKHFSEIVTELYHFLNM